MGDDAVARQRRALLALVQLDKSDLGAALPQILEASARTLEVARVGYWRFTDGQRQLACERMYELAPNRFSSGQVLDSREYPRFLSALGEDRAIHAHRAAEDPRTAEFSAYFTQNGVTSLLDVPVWHRGQLSGVICHEHAGPARAWMESEVDFAVSVAGMVTVGLEGEARRHAEATWELLTTAMQDLVWDWDLQSGSIHWNAATVSLLRFRASEVEPSFEWWKAQVHPDDLQRVLAGLDRHVASGSGVWRDEYRFRRGDGSWAMIADRGVLARNEDGTPRRMVGAMTDVTEQRRLESRLAVSDRMASVGTLAAGVAHEINNPLTFIHGNLSYALARQAPESEVSRALAEALSGVERVQRIVLDLKSFSRPEERPSRVDVRAAIASAISLAQNEIRHRARLREEHAQLPRILGNAARLGQVVLNLLINAAQAIPDGRAEDNEIVIRTRALNHDRVVIEVTDSGSGISPELLGRIFDPFFTTKQVGEGIGLGLTICHSIVTSMGGQLTLENNPGRGATARVDLPAAPEAPEEPAPPPPPPERPVVRGRVLVIDDVPNVAISMKRLLSEFHEVDTFHRARDAVRALSEGQRWDVILCDLMMPELNGMELVEALRAIDPALVPRVAIMSGGAFTAQAEAFLRSWPHLQLEKPIRPQKLIDEVNRAVAMARAGGG